MTIDENTVILNRCHVDHCQTCGKPFGQIEIVYYVPIDNNLVCREYADDANETGGGCGTEDLF